VPSHKPPSQHVHELFKKVNIPYQQLLTPLKWGQKSKFGAEIFRIDARIAYVLVIKKLDFFYFVWNLCGISKVALVECEWLILKLRFGLDNDIYWI
jgi:hypothetical protein